MIQSAEIYTRQLEGCFEIDAGNGEKVYEMLGRDNGKTTQLSIAMVIIQQNGLSLPHHHKTKEESYIILKGEGRLEVDGAVTTVKPGDVVLIPLGKVHQIFNDFKDDLEFYCVCAPAWVYEDFHIGKADKTEGKEIYKKKKEDCQAITSVSGQAFYKLLERSDSAAAKHTVTLIEMPEGCTSIPEAPEAEGSFLIVEGKGKLVIGDKEKEVTSGDVAKIPASTMHQISTIGQETLKFYSIRG